MRERVTIKLADHSEVRTKTIEQLPEQLKAVSNVQEAIVKHVLKTMTPLLEVAPIHSVPEQKPQISLKQKAINQITGRY